VAQRPQSITSLDGLAAASGQIAFVFKKTIWDSVAPVGIETLSVAPVGIETLGPYPAHGRERPSAFWWRVTP